MMTETFNYKSIKEEYGDDVRKLVCLTYESHENPRNRHWISSPPKGWGSRSQRDATTVKIVKLVSLKHMNCHGKTRENSI